MQNRPKEVVWEPVDHLDLDPENPRLPESIQGSSQDELIRYIALTYAMFELAQSLADNGYFSEEPLVACKTPARNRYKVVEGNAV